MVYSLKLTTIFVKSTSLDVWQGTESAPGGSRPKYSTKKQMRWFCLKQSCSIFQIILRFILGFADFGS